MLAAACLLQVEFTDADSDARQEFESVREEVRLMSTHTEVMPAPAPFNVAGLFCTCCRVLLMEPMVASVTCHQTASCGLSHLRLLSAHAHAAVMTHPGRPAVFAALRRPPHKCHCLTQSLKRTSSNKYQPSRALQSVLLLLPLRCATAIVRSTMCSKSSWRAS